MADDADPKASGSKGLPTLPKKRQPGPFDKLASLAEMAEPPPDLREQAERDPAAPKDAIRAQPTEPRGPADTVAIGTGGKRRGRPAKPVEGEQIFLQTTLPLPTFQAFKMHCIDRRTTVREELRRLVEEMLARKDRTRS